MPSPSVRFLLLSAALAITVQTFRVVLIDYQQNAYNYCQAQFPHHHDYHPIPGGRLVQLQVLVRHGDRTPIDHLPEDVTWNCSLTHHNLLFSEHCVTGQLTSKGHLQHISLGQHLRQIYIDKLHFLPENVTLSAMQNDQILHARATDYPRTRQSARALLSGLYPAHTRLPDDPEEDWNDGKVPDFDVHWRSRDNDTMLPPMNCPRRSILFDRMMRHPQFLKYNKRRKAFRKDMDKIIGPPPANYSRDSLIYALDTLRTRECHHFPLPCSQKHSKKCITEHHLMRLTKYIREESQLLFRTLPQAAEYSRLGHGRLLAEITHHILEHALGHDRRRPMRLFSAHDDTLFGMLGNLHAENINWPPYASNMQFELWEMLDGSGDMRVRIIYNGEPVHVKWCDMSQGCNLYKFVEFAKKQVPGDLDAECRDLTLLELDEVLIL